MLVSYQGEEFDSSIFLFFFVFQLNNTKFLHKHSNLPQHSPYKKVRFFALIVLSSTKCVTNLLLCPTVNTIVLLFSKNYQHKNTICKLAHSNLPQTFPHKHIGFFELLSETIAPQTISSHPTITPPPPPHPPPPLLLLLLFSCAQQQNERVQVIHIIGSVEWSPWSS